MLNLRDGKFATLRTKVLWTALFFICFMVGRNVPIPLLQPLATGGPNMELINAASTATGGSFTHASLFSLGLGPWMGAAVLWRFLFIGKIARSRNIPEERVNQARYGVMLVLAVSQSLSLMSTYRVAPLPGPFSGMVNSQIVITVILTLGSLTVAWMAMRNQDLGLGGLTMFILYQIIITAVQNLGSLKIGTNPEYHLVLALVGLACVCIAIIVIFAGNAELRLHVNKVSIDNGFSGLSYLPIKLNPAGASPIMYALALLAIPPYIARAAGHLIPAASGATNDFLASWGLSTPLGFSAHVLLLIAMTIFFGLFTIDPKDVAKRMKDSGEYFDNVAPGEPTRQYLRRRVIALSGLTGIVLSILTGIPLYFIGAYPHLMYILMAPGTVMIILGLLWMLQEEISDTMIGKRYSFDLRASPTTRAPA